MDYYTWRGILRNYVRDNTLCAIASDFDARSRKIRRVAMPEDDSDAVNRLYVERCFKTLSVKQLEFEKKHEELERNLIKLHVNSEALREKIGKLVQRVNMLHSDE